jgi:hypothetical protein
MAYLIISYKAISGKLVTQQFSAFVLDHFDSYPFDTHRETPLKILPLIPPFKSLVSYKPHQRHMRRNSLNYPVNLSFQFFGIDQHT